jgi:3-phosphoshikimate 1-carboxyvinyltransferase
MSRIIISKSIPKDNVTINSCPGDKSISHRSIIIPSLCQNEVKIHNILNSEDVIMTRNALIKLGVQIKDEDGVVSIKGVGKSGFKESNDVLDMGNSGTSARLLMGLVSASDISSTFTGDESLRKRPMKRVMSILEKNGCKFISRKSGFFPLSMMGSTNINNANLVMESPSAQLKSAAILSLIQASGRSSILEPQITRDHTERMLKYFGADMEISDDKNGRNIIFGGDVDLKAKDIHVPADPSSAAFLVAIALLHDINLTIKNVLINQTRIGFYEILAKMGANISFQNVRNISNEEVADIVISPSELFGIEIDESIAPRMIDEYLILSIISSFANGKTVMRGLSELKIKESDRFDAIVNNLKKCGIEVDFNDSDISIFGNGNKNLQRDVVIESNLDHRVAMSFIIAGTRSDANMTVNNCDCINTSFPNFLDILNTLNIKYEENH